MVEAELMELVNRIKKIKSESQVIELKSALNGCPKKLYDTISAFSNQDTGGTIIFGIDESRGYKVTGVYNTQDLIHKVNEQCKQMMPVVRPVFTVLDTEEGNIVSAEIPGMDVSERPCYYAGVGRIKGSYIRAGTSDEPMSEYEIYSYEAFRKKYEDDIRINEKAEMTAIDSLQLDRYIGYITENNVKLSRLPEEDIRRFLNMAVDGKPTLACTLLFSIYPQMFYPQYTINAMVVPGYEKGAVSADGSRFSDNKRIEGTLMEMLDGAMKFFSRNMRVRTVIDKVTGKRSDIPEYPPIALREAVLNALIHRDYSIHTESMPIEVIMYRDRLEIRNPGGLYGRLTIDKLGKMQPDTRNPVLARALETLKVTENRYSGIPAIRRELNEAGMREAVFLNSRNEFAVTFYNDTNDQYDDDLEKKAAGIPGFCREPRTRKDISEMLGKKTGYYVSKKYIEPLLRAGKIRMTIPEHPKSKNQRFYSV